MATKAKKKADQNGAAPPAEEKAGPSFDFRRVDGSWRRRLRRLGALEARAQARLNALYEAGDFSDEELEAVMDEADKIDRQQDEIMAAVLVDVPAGWLIYDAPDGDGIDWSDPASLDYIRQDYRVQLYTGMLMAAGNPVGN